MRSKSIDGQPLRHAAAYSDTPRGGTNVDARVSDGQVRRLEQELRSDLDALDAFAASAPPAL